MRIMQLWNREITKFLINWKNLLVEDATQKDDLFI